MANQFMNILANLTPRSNRSLADLQNSKDQLSGMDAMELRGWASQNPFIPTRDLTDPLGQALLTTIQHQNDALQTYLESQIASTSLEAVINTLSTARWGPTRIPIFTTILPFFLHFPHEPPHLLSLTHYLARDIGVPVDGTDATGTTALYCSISCRPYALPSFAQILFDAGARINHQNRSGATAAREIAHLDFATDPSANIAMLKWFLQHGGDVCVKDNDGISASIVVDMMSKRVPLLKDVLNAGRGERADGQCLCCGRAGALNTCARCKSVRYCGAECQRVDWKAHKKVCKATTTA